MDMITPLLHAEKNESIQHDCAPHTNDINNNQEKEENEISSFFLHSHWLFLHDTSLSVGFYVLISWLFLLAQVITLFDLSYQEDLQSYKCMVPGQSFLLPCVVF